MAEDAGNTSVCAVLHSEFPNGLQEERIYREPVKMVTFTRQVSKIEDPTEKLCCIPQARAFEQALDAFEQAPEAEPTNGQNRAAILSAAVRTAVMQGKAEDLRWLLRALPHASTPSAPCLVEACAAPPPLPSTPPPPPAPLPSRAGATLLGAAIGRAALTAGCGETAPLPPWPERAPPPTASTTSVKTSPVGERHKAESDGAALLSARIGA